MESTKQEVLIKNLKALYEMNMITPRVEERIKKVLVSEIMGYLKEDKKESVEPETFKTIKAEEPAEKEATYQELKFYWNKNKRLAKIRKITAQREKKIDSRLKKYDLNQIKLAINKINNSDFCTGKNSRNWAADFDWLFKNDTNISKVLEGKYDNKQSYKNNFDKKINIDDVLGLFTISGHLSKECYFDNEYLTLNIFNKGYVDLEKLSDKIGVSKTTIQNWIEGNYNPNYKNTISLIRQLDLISYKLIYRKGKLPEVKSRLYYIENEKIHNYFRFNHDLLRNKINKNNISVVDISTYTNIKKDKIERWIKGQAIPNQDDFFRLARYLYKEHNIETYRLNKNTIYNIISSQEMSL